MCEVMSGLSLAMMALGAGMSAYGQYQQGRAQSAQAEYQSRLAARNADQARMQADYAREQGAEDAARQRRQTRQSLGEQRSLLAASGADLADADSSAASILSDTARWGEYDARKIRHQGEMNAWGYENQALGSQTEAALYSAGARQATRAGAAGAGASLLSGAGQVAGQWYRYHQQGWGKNGKRGSVSADML